MLVEIHCPCTESPIGYTLYNDKSGFGISFSSCALTADRTVEYKTAANEDTKARSYLQMLQFKQCYTENN